VSLPALLKSSPGQSLSVPTYELALFRYVGRRWRRKAATTQQQQQQQQQQQPNGTNEPSHELENEKRTPLPEDVGSESGGVAGVSAWLDARRGVPGAFDPQHICPNGTHSDVQQGKTAPRSAACTRGSSRL
jgi:hypothetical protein